MKLKSTYYIVFYNKKNKIPIGQSFSFESNFLTYDKDLKYSLEYAINFLIKIYKRLKTPLIYKVYSKDYYDFFDPRFPSWYD